MSEARGRSVWKWVLGAAGLLLCVSVAGTWVGTRLSPDPNLIAVGAAAPVVALEGSDGAPVDLGALRGGGAQVLVFYRGHW